METIDAVISNYNFLSDVCSLTKVPVLLTDKHLKPFKSKIIKYQEELKRLGIIDTVDKNIVWSTTDPTIELAYNFYTATQKKDMCFADIKSILENPQNYSNTELKDAIAINGYYVQKTGNAIIESQEDVVIEEVKKPKADEIAEMTYLIENNYSVKEIAEMLWKKYAADVE